jgi:ATP-dependent helicase/nuclease subunit B
LSSAANKLPFVTGHLREKFRMQVHFLLGPAGSGKTFRCLAEIGAALRKVSDGPPMVLLAPKQATFQLERQLLAGAGISGYTRLHILSFERLARFVLETCSSAPPPMLSEEGRAMVLRALLLRHADRLKVFGRSARRPGFAGETSKLLNELQQLQLTPAKLRAIGQASELAGELRSKLHDLALLLESYLHWLGEHALQDDCRLLDSATEGLRGQNRIQNSKFKIECLWLDGFAEMTPQEMDLLAAVLPYCERATLAFCLDETERREASWLSIWNTVGQTFQQCRRRIENLPGCIIEMTRLDCESGRNRFSNNPVLGVLAAHWPGGSGLNGTRRSPDACPDPGDALQIAGCSHPDAEAVFAAREILKFVRTEGAGNRFRDCAVLVRDLEPYHRPVARAFRRYGIPFFLDRRESVAHHPMAELTRSALRTVAFDWRQEDWFAALKAGFSPVAESEIDRLENAALEFGWRGKKWREPLPENSFENLRKKILPPFERLADRLARLENSPTGVQLADALRELWDELGVETTLQKWGAREADDPSPVNRHASFHATVWDQMNSWLDNIALAFPGESLSLRDWLHILEAGLATLTAGVIPPVLDAVLVGAIDRARNPELKLALVLGLNESVFPASPASPPILTDADRDELEQRGVGLGPDLREQISCEGFYGYIASTRASKKLLLTYSRRDADGKVLNPSPFIARLQAIFPRLEPENVGDEMELAEVEHASELVTPLLEIKNSKLKIQNWEKLLEIPALKPLAARIGELREPGEKENLSEKQSERLFGRTLRTSVTRLEEFAQCPFKFFVRFGLRAEERKLFELDARQRGSFQHEVLKGFHEQIVGEGKNWRDLKPAEARERVRKIAAGIIENFRDGLMRDSAQARFEARAMTESLQDFVEVIVTWMRGQYEFDPITAELDFGSKESPETAWELELGGGHKLALQGRIDRVDLYRTTAGRAWCVVMDYKSSGKKLDSLLVEHGVQLQLPAYLNVMRHWPNPRERFGVGQLVPGGVFYVNLRGKLESRDTRDEILDLAAARKLAYRHTGRFDAGILPILDHTGAMDQFNYRLNQDGSLRKGSGDALPHGEFDAWLNRAELKVQEMGRAILAGEAKVDPYRKGSETPCQFCDYRAICRIDPWTHRYRVLRAVAKEDPG